MNAYTFVHLIHDVLKSAHAPLTTREIWEKAKEAELDQKLGSKGLTPWATVGATISSDIIHNRDQSDFIKRGNPQRYFLKSREHEITGETSQVELNHKPVEEKSTYSEKDLHSLLAYFTATNEAFFGDKVVYTKTITHQKTRTKRKSNSLNEWLHPDMVGAYFPFDNLSEDVIKLSQRLNSDLVRLFSFELKKSIDKSNYRECFFQAVSNSSWAHEGYLVAAKISEDDELRRELGRLNNAFGIGIIHLNVYDIDSSRVLFESKNKSELDWETIGKLHANKDFSSFIGRLNIDINSNRVHTSEYDSIISNPSEYIKTKLKVKTVE